MILRQIATHALVLFSLGAWTQDSWGQAVTLAPTPTGLNDEVTLTIDVSQSAEHGLKAVLEANPTCPFTSGPGAPATLSEATGLGTTATKACFFNPPAA